VVKADASSADSLVVYEGAEENFSTVDLMPAVEAVRAERTAAVAEVVTGATSVLGKEKESSVGNKGFLFFCS
jgi:hypothetical protein